MTAIMSEKRDAYASNPTSPKETKGAFTRQIAIRIVIRIVNPCAFTRAALIQDYV